MGDEALPPGDAMPKKKKQVIQLNCQNEPNSRRKMSLCRFEVRVGGMTHDFDDPDRFLQCLQGEEDTSADIYVRGVPARGGAGSQGVTDFFCQELRLVRLPGRWQKRALQYLRNQCGHRFLKEGAVCQAREEIPGGDEGEGCSKSLEFQADDTFSERVGTRSPAHLMMLPDSSLGGINTGSDSKRVNSSGSLAPTRLLSLQHQNQQQQQKQTSPPTVISREGSCQDL